MRHAQSHEPDAAFEAALMHGHDWCGQDVTGWHITEKLDGCRARWTGAALLSRTGRPIDAPRALLNALPRDIALDLEVYAGRGRREFARMAVQHGRWGTGVELVAFDAPDVGANWVQRRAWIERHVGLPVVASFGVVSSLHALAELLHQVQGAGGEGLMVNHPGRAYTRSRTPYLLKVKRPDILREHLQALEAA